MRKWSLKACQRKNLTTLRRRQDACQISSLYTKKIEVWKQISLILHMPICPSDTSQSKQLSGAHAALPSHPISAGTLIMLITLRLAHNKFGGSLAHAPHHWHQVSESACVCTPYTHMHVGDMMCLLPPILLERATQNCCCCWRCGDGGAHQRLTWQRQ